MTEGFKAIVIPATASSSRANRPHVFNTFSSALAFMRGTRASTVIIEFSVEVETLDFYDAVKAISVPVIFSANRLDASQFSQLGIRAADVVCPNDERGVESFAGYRPRPGLKGSRSNVRLMTSSALLEA